MAKYKRFQTILKENGCGDDPIAFLRRLMEAHPNVRAAAHSIGTSHATLYAQLDKLGLVVKKRGLILERLSAEREEPLSDDLSGQLTNGAATAER